MRAALALLLCGCSLKTSGLGEPTTSLVDAAVETAVIDSTVDVELADSGTAVLETSAPDADADADSGMDAGCAPVLGDPCATIAQLPVPQKIDGSDSEFCNVPYVDLDATNAEFLVPKPAAPWSSARARARVAWSKDGLHLHVAVKDPLFAPAPASTDPWRGDVVELFAAGHTALTGLFDGDKKDKGATHIMLTRPQLDGASRGAIYYQTFSRDLAAGTFIAVARPDGYDVEVVLPWTLLEGASIATGAKIGFDFAINDRRELVTTTDQYLGFRVRKPLPPSFCGGLYCDDRVWCQPTLE